MPRTVTCGVKVTLFPGSALIASTFPADAVAVLPDFDVVPVTEKLIIWLWTLAESLTPNSAVTGVLAVIH